MSNNKAYNYVTYNLIRCTTNTNQTESAKNVALDAELDN